MFQGSLLFAIPDDFVGKELLLAFSQTSFAGWLRVTLDLGQFFFFEEFHIIVVVSRALLGRTPYSEKAGFSFIS